MMTSPRCSVSPQAATQSWCHRATLRPVPGRQAASDRGRRPGVWISKRSPGVGCQSHARRSIHASSRSDGRAAALLQKQWAQRPKPPHARNDVGSADSHGNGRWCRLRRRSHPPGQRQVVSRLRGFRLGQPAPMLCRSAEQPIFEVLDRASDHGRASIMPCPTKETSPPTFTVLTRFALPSGSTCKLLGRPVN